MQNLWESLKAYKYVFWLSLPILENDSEIFLRKAFRFSFITILKDLFSPKKTRNKYNKSLPYLPIFFFKALPKNYSLLEEKHMFITSSKITV